MEPNDKKNQEAEKEQTNTPNTSDAVQQGQSESPSTEKQEEASTEKSEQSEDKEEGKGE